MNDGTDARAREIVDVDGRITAFGWLDLAKAAARADLPETALACLRFAFAARERERTERGAW